MSEQWYVTSNSEPFIEPIDVERYTDSSVWVIERVYDKEGLSRRGRISDWHGHFPTFAEAKQHLNDKFSQMTESAMKKATYQQNRLRKLLETEEDGTKK